MPIRRQNIADPEIACSACPGDIVKLAFSRIPDANGDFLNANGKEKYDGSLGGP
jgi:hypothetical protein